MQESQQYKQGVAYALAAFLFWGVAPIYFKWVAAVPALEVLAHRIVWSVLLLVGIVAAQRHWRELWQAIRTPATVRMLLLSASFITVNWGLFIYAIQQNQILQTSLGYYINPLISVLLGMAVLGERLRRLQWLAVLLAATGTAIMTIGADKFPWIALVLAVCFAFYGLVRKKVEVAAFTGLLIETALLLPVAVGYLLWLNADGQGTFVHRGMGISWLLVAAGAVTTIPLLWFTNAARRLPLSLIGFFQYIAPSVSFLLAVFVYDEPFTLMHGIMFGCIWTAIALFMFDTALARRRGTVWRDVEQRQVGNIRDPHDPVE